MRTAHTSPDSTRISTHLRFVTRLPKHVKTLPLQWFTEDGQRVWYWDINVHSHACTRAHEQILVVHFKAAISKTFKLDTFSRYKYYPTLALKGRKTSGQRAWTLRGRLKLKYGNYVGKTAGPQRKVIPCLFGTVGSLKCNDNISLLGNFYSFSSPAAVFCWAGPGGIPPRERVETPRPPKSWVGCWMILERLPSTWSAVDEPFLNSLSVCHWPSDSTVSPMVRSTFPPTPASET